MSHHPGEGPRPHDEPYQGASYGPAGDETRAERRRPRHRIGRKLLLLLLVLLLIIGVVTAFAINHLTGNIRTLNLSTQSQSIADSKGKPLDILILGSDGRNNPADCKIGGDCPPGVNPNASSSASASTSHGTSHDSQFAGTNADTQMLLHISADRQHAEIVSLPRDTVVDIPECVGPDGKTEPARKERINSSMQASPDCTRRTVEKLSGIKIPHLAVIDFVGVITMSNAVGGVPVCVSDNVYDPYSHLKLSKGTHELKGEAALQFVRTRHGFGNGGDLGRVNAQHMFLGNLITQVKSAGTLLNPVRLYDVADAGTKALTVDEGLSRASDLVALAGEFNKVPTENINFSTLPTIPNPENPNELVPANNADAFWEKVRQLGVASSAAPTPSSSKPKSPSPSSSPSTSKSNSQSPSPSSSGGMECAQVSTRNTVEIKGQVMTPTEAYDASPHVPDSAP